MKLQTIVNRVNKLLAEERHTSIQLMDHLDSTIDDINQALGSKYPAFSELPEGATDYDFFPDRYIRTVVCFGAAWYYYTTDEEGIETAPQYGLKYRDAIFAMARDHMNYVPEEYQDNDLKGMVDPRTLEDGERGVEVDGQNILP